VKPSFALCVDIDNTIAEPCWYDEDLHICKQQYLNACIVTAEEVAAFERHQRLFLHYLSENESKAGRKRMGALSQW
jgi:hypothetical protein